jgi:hypothetical protein
MDEIEEDKARAVQAAHVILDGVMVADVADGGVVNDATELAFGRLFDVGAIAVSVEEAADGDEDDLQLQLDIAPLLGAITLVVGHLVDELARHGSVSREDVIAGAREALAR